MNIIITGASGMVGGEVMEECLRRNEVDKVTVIVRKPLGINHPKLNEVIYQNFMNYASIEEHFSNQDVCFYCIGVYTGQVSKEEFSRITVDFTKAFADTLKKNSPGCAFCFLSGDGADPKEKSLMIFAREKGKAENHLQKLEFPRLHIFRPGYIYPIKKRKEPNLMYSIMRAIYKPVSKVFPDIGLTSKQLSSKMVNVGLHGGDKTFYLLKDIKA